MNAPRQTMESVKLSLWLHLLDQSPTCGLAAVMDVESVLSNSIEDCKASRTFSTETANVDMNEGNKSPMDKSALPSTVINIL